MPPAQPASAARGTRGAKSAGKQQPKKEAGKGKKPVGGVKSGAVGEGKLGEGAAAAVGLSEQQRPIIFLDVDGVIVPFGGEEDEDAKQQEAKAAAALQRSLVSLSSIITAQQVPPRLVLSSTWRCSPPAVEELRGHFNAFGPPLSTVSLDETTSLDEHSHRRYVDSTGLNPTTLFITSLSLSLSLAHPLSHTGIVAHW